jgi:hypothetical protein
MVGIPFDVANLTVAKRHANTAPAGAHIACSLFDLDAPNVSVGSAFWFLHDSGTPLVSGRKKNYITISTYSNIPKEVLQPHGCLWLHGRGK